MSHTRTFGVNKDQDPVPSTINRRESIVYLDYLNISTEHQSRTSRGRISLKGKAEQTLSQVTLRRNKPTKSETWRRFRPRFNWASCTCGNCCGHESSEYDEDYSFFKRKKMKKLDKVELVACLDRAACEISHKIDYKDIDAEADKWADELDREDRLYEESDRPKFKYNWFRKHHYVIATKHPIYATSYDNHRRLEVRVEEFRFGAVNHRGERLGKDVNYGYRPTREAKDSAYWRTDQQVLYANIALLCSTANFIRFPEACYQNGGFLFFLTYCVLIIAVGQPLLYFEMVIGQCSFHGPSGFARLHPYGKGIPVAILFVLLVFGTSRSIYLAYCALCVVISGFQLPGYCDRSEFEVTTSLKSRYCIPYSNYEDEPYKSELLADRHRNVPKESFLRVFSQEIFFREKMMHANWETGEQSLFINWKLVLSILIVCCISFVPVHYGLRGRHMKRYLRNSLLLPLLLLLIFAHQIFFRGGGGKAGTYFFQLPSTDELKFEHIFLHFTAAFEMVLSTLGIGYGYHWAVSGNVSLDYHNMYKTSWCVSVLTMLFGLLSSLVIFCEVGIVGEFLEEEKLNRVFRSDLGIPFICYSGAITRIGRFPQRTIMPIFIFDVALLLLIIYGMWSQIIVTNAIFRLFERGQIIKGKMHWKIKQRKTTYIIVILFQLGLALPYYFKSSGAVLANEYVFSGTVAAYTVVMAEVIIALYLYGFPRFLADLEIMSKRRVATLFQIQIRYFVLPVVLVFTIPLLLRVYNSQHGKSTDELGRLLYLGLITNFVPAFFIILMSIHYDFSFQPNKVNPLEFIFGTNESKTREEIQTRYPIREPKFVGKADAPSQAHRISVQSDVYQCVEHRMLVIHKSQDFVKGKFSKLLAFKRAQANWLKLVLCSLSRRRRVRSFPTLVQRIMIGRLYRNVRIDLRFLGKSLDQILNLSFVSAVRKLQRMKVPEMLHYMADELLQVTICRFDNTPYKMRHLASSSESESSDSDSSSSSDSSSTSSGISEFDGKNRKRRLQLHRKLFGQLDRSMEESRTHLIIRLKRGLEMPYDEEMRVLKYLRREREKVGREMSFRGMKNFPVLDHFLPISVNEGEKRKTFAILHGVVVEGKDHVVLKRLPVPRPTIVYKTKKEVVSQIGKTYMDKVAQIMVKSLYPMIPYIIKKRNWRHLPGHKIKRFLSRVADNIDDDVYDFLDRYLTCVIVVTGDADQQKLGKKMYLTPRTRRKHEDHVYADFDTKKARRLGYLGQINPTDIDQIQESRRRQLAAEAFLEQEPSDIVFHRDSTDSDDGSFQVVSTGWDVVTSSGSSSTLSDTNEPTLEQLRWIQELPEAEHTLRKTVQLLKTSTVTYETLQARDHRLLLEKPRLEFWSENEISSTTNFILDVSKIKHISARKWKHKRSKTQQDFKYSRNEIRLHEKIESEAAAIARITQSATNPSAVASGRSGLGHDPSNHEYSLVSLRHMLSSDKDFVVDIKLGKLIVVSRDKLFLKVTEERLKNIHPDQAYVGFGKVLIVDQGRCKLITKRLCSRAKYFHPETIALEDSGCVDQDRLAADEIQTLVDMNSLIHK